MNTTTEKTYYTDLHSDFNHWKSDLEFYVEEMNFFKKRLEEVVSKNTSKDMLAQAEHFQNQFIVQKNVIDTLLHKIHVGEDELNDYVKNHTTAVDHIRMERDKSLLDEMVQFERLWKSMKKEYLRYISAWM